MCNVKCVCSIISIGMFQSKVVNYVRSSIKLNCELEKIEDDV